MKKLICIFSFMALNLPATFAQDHFNHHSRPHPNPLLIAGIITGSVGVVGLGFGGLIYGLSSNTPGGANTALPVMAVGGALIVGGAIMIFAGVSQMHSKRFTLVAPKPNQFGIAYNLSGR